MKNNLLAVFKGLTTLCLFVGLLYGIYCLGKTVSYKLFYEDMVKQTIIEMREK